ncbi:MAG: pilus assembly protein PilZ [Geobacter sp.]|nr:MAG: pilus assembly protein PilZ [Geobacter sp.]
MDNPLNSPGLLPCAAQVDSLAHDKTVNKRYLVNKLNFLNFQDQTILVSFRHARYDNTMSFRAKPLPCAGEHLECTWEDSSDIEQMLNMYRFEYLLITDGHKLLLVNAQVISMNSAGITLLLPANCREYKNRRIKRHPCIGITTQFSQNSTLFHGSLIDFTPVSFLVDGSTESPQAVRWAMVDSRVNLHLYAGTEILYTGECIITRESRKQEDGRRRFVLRPATSSIQLIKPKQYRNKRQELVPSPNMVFRHPLIGSTVNLKVADLSGSGFSVEESVETSILLPGMIIPGIELSFAHGLSISCKAQVVSRNLVENEGEEVVKCGLAILDMDIHEHVKLLSILHQAEDKNSYVCTDVDMNALWDFFFETGFIYPEKYAYFQANKEQIKQTYDKLYGQNPHIARHFIHLERGKILGHMAMVRFYEDSWLIHHHAARKSVSAKAGLKVLNQVGQYLNELQNLHFTRLHFVYCYFRPENRFPNRVFGEFARQLNNPRGCSLDKFAYLHYRGKSIDDGTIPEPWKLAEANSFDFAELGSFYAFVSGGLMIDAFDLHPGFACQDEVAKEYRKLGFKKEKHYYALRKEGTLKAMIMANCTDAGFNMANLTNCAIFIALDETIPADILGLALGQVSELYDEEEMPVLIYPFSFVEERDLQYEKVYMLWILDLHYSDDYFRFCDGLFKGARTTD